MSDFIRLVEALAWPVVVLVGIFLLVSARGRDLLSRVVGRVSRLKAGQLEVEFTAETSREVKGTLSATFRMFRERTTEAFDAQVHVERIPSCLEKVAQEDIIPSLTDCNHAFRATIYVPDLLFEDVLYRLVDYYPAGGGRGRTYSARFGIIGLVWRLQRSERASVPAGTDALVREWGMTIAEATRRHKAKSFVCVILRDAAQQRVGLLFVDAEEINAFKSNVVERLEGSSAQRSLAQAVDRVTRHVRETAQPPLKIFDE